MAEQPTEFCRKVVEEVGTIAAVEQDFPLTDIVDRGLLAELIVRFFGTETVAGGASSGDAEELVRNFNVWTPQHGDIVKGVDGKTWMRFLKYVMNKDPQRANTGGAFSLALPLPFEVLANRLYSPVRSKDLMLWLKGNSTVKLSTRLGAITRIVSGGTSPTSTITGRMYARTLPDPDPRPVSDGGDLPGLQPVMFMGQFPTLKAGENKFRVPVGDGLQLYGMMLATRVAATDAEVTNMHQDDVTLVSVKHGNDEILNDVGWKDWNENVARHFGTAIDAGYLFIPLMKKGSLIEGRNCEDDTKTLEVTLTDIQNITSNTIKVFMWGAKPTSTKVKNA